MALYRACCSDPLSPEALGRWSLAEAWLVSLGLKVEHLAAGTAPWSASPEPDWSLVLDPSGGSSASLHVASLMEGLSPRNPDRRAWWSMSDNSVVLDALLDRGVCRLLHGHPLTLAGKAFEAQRHRFQLWYAALAAGAPFPREALPLLNPHRGGWNQPFALVGGNLTALERLGETPWRPRPQGRILLLESLTCPAEAAPHRVAALVEDPWWESIGGVLFGRFTAADRDPNWWDRCVSLLPPDLPLARCPLIGHGSDAWTVPLGEVLTWPVSSSSAE